MRRIIFTLLAFIGIGLLTAEAQNLRQEALVKTRGRLQDDGSVTAGKPVVDAEVQIKNGPKVFSDSTGSLSFGVPANKAFYVQRVAKEGYILSDYDIISREQQYSSKTLDILLEDEAELRRYRRIIESKVRRNYQNQMNLLTTKVDSLEASGYASRQELDSLYAVIDKSWELAEESIKEMTERYLKIDFDREEAFDREISAYILNGKLEKADSMLRSKGNLAERAERNKQARNAIDKEVSNIAKEYDYRAQICHQRMQRDSAAYWLEQKAQFDSENIDWLLVAGEYISLYLSDYERVLSIYKPTLDFTCKHYGEMHEKTANLYNNIGLAYFNQGNYEKAIEYLFKALAILEKVLGTEHPDTAISYNNIGLVYFDLGDYEKAIEYHFKALTIQEKVLASEHPETATSYNNIGAIYGRQGDYEKAIEYLFKALAIKEKVLGTEHPDTAISYNNIGGVYYNLGDYEKAIEHYFKALAIREKVLGTEHPDTAISYNNIGLMYNDCEDYDNALEYYFKALTIQEEVIGIDHPDTATSYNNIGSVYGRQGNYEKALEYFFRALTIQEKVLVSEHPETARSYNNIGFVYHSQGNYENALKYYFKALAIHEKVLGTEHRETALSYNNIGFVYFDLGDYDNALEFLIKAKNSNERLFGSDNLYGININKAIKIINAQVKQ